MEVPDKVDSSYGESVNIVFKVNGTGITSISSFGITVNEVWVVSTTANGAEITVMHPINTNTIFGNSLTGVFHKEQQTVTLSISKSLFKFDGATFKSNIVYKGPKLSELDKETQFSVKGK